MATQTVIANHSNGDHLANNQNGRLSQKTTVHQWEEVSSGHWRRKLFGMEPYFVFFGNLTASMVNGREHYTICSSVQLTKSVDIRTLQKAWVRLRFQQPKLAVSSDASDWTMHYSVPDEIDIKNWIDQTFFVVPDASYNTLYPELKPITTATLYWLPQTNELVFRAPHWQTDGIGSLLFWDAFFSSFEQSISQSTGMLAWGTEVARLSPTVPDIWKISEIKASNREEGQALFGNWVTNVPGLGPDPIKPTPGKCQKVELEFDQKSTASMVTNIKKQGMTVTAAFHAAFAEANAEVAKHSSSVKSQYATMSNVDLRKYLGPSSSTSAEALNVYYAPIPLVTPVESFRQTAEVMSNHYKQKYDNSAKHEILCGFLELLFQVAQSPEFLGAPVPGDAMLSSLGVVEKFFKTTYADGLIQISDLHNSIDVVLGMALAFVYTFEGKLRFTYCFNEGLQDRSLVDGIVASTEAILRKEFLS